MVVVVVEVWAKVYKVEVEVRVEWMDDVSMENPVLSAEQHSAVRHVLLPHRCLKEV